MRFQVVSSVESSPDILAQVQEIIVPIIQFTLENKLLGTFFVLFTLWQRRLTDKKIDLFDNMYELVDSLTFKLRAISPSLWPIFEATYKLFKSDAIDFLDGALASP
jgi:hypothetical protein